MWLTRPRLPLRSWSTVRYASLRPNPWSKKGPPERPARPRNSQPPESASSQNDASSAGPSQSTEQSRINSLSTTLGNTDPQTNTLLAPVHIPEDPNAVLKERHPAAGILANSGLAVQRQLEMMNVMLGFEQANRYVILDAQGNHVGYIAEEDKSMGKMFARQWLNTHRAFVTHVFDRHQNEVLRFHRPFSWINSRIRVYDPLHAADSARSSVTSLQTASGDSITTNTAEGMARVSPLDFSNMRVIGEAHQQWAPLRRKYNLFLSSDPQPETNLDGKTPLSHANSSSQQLQTTRDSVSGEFSQFAYVDEPFLSWDFSLRSADSRLIGSVNRNFVGFARELFTDTGVYALRMDSAGLAEERGKSHLVSQAHKDAPEAPVEKAAGMSLDQRAVMLATAVSVDFDYFSRHSGSHGFMPIPFFGGASSEGAAAGGAAGAAGGAVEGAAAGEATGAVLGETAAERTAAGVAGAGTMAGYEAMQRGATGSSSEQPPQGTPEEQMQQGQQDPWSDPGSQDPWGLGGDEGKSPPSMGGQDGSGGGGDGSGLGDFFDEYF